MSEQTKTVRTSELTEGMVVVAPLLCGQYDAAVAIQSVTPYGTRGDLLVQYADYEGMWDSVISPADYRWAAIVPAKAGDLGPEGDAALDDPRFGLI